MVVAEFATTTRHDKSVVSSHIKNVLEEQLDKKEVIANFATTTRCSKFTCHFEIR